MSFPLGRVLYLGKQAAVMADGTAYALHPDRDGVPEERVVRAWRISPKDQRVPTSRASDGCLLNRTGQITCDSKTTIGASDTTFETLTTSSTLFPHWEHACAIDKGQKLWCWGDGGSGQLGDGQPVCSTTPRDLSPAFYGAFAEAN